MRTLAVIGVLAAAAVPSGAGLAGAAGSKRAPQACHSAMRHGVLPVSARTGFSSPRPRMPHVLGARGDITAIVFGYPLFAPPAQTRTNKILWVAREHSQPLGDLRIHAQRMRGATGVGRPVVRVVPGGPGPSIINLPTRGCWRLTLDWAGRHDTLDLDYVKLRRAPA
jgi:hypothetical protein